MIRQGPVELLRRQDKLINYYRVEAAKHRRGRPLKSGEAIDWDRYTTEAAEQAEAEAEEVEASA